ncbi:MAG: TonB-dependent receptor plug domain-containing protein, partial [Planctomycetes bacterium]|nr:TonB-dependent receptor plug domain-containing protein [Planctomycetota bacterium]
MRKKFTILLILMVSLIIVSDGLRAGSNVEDEQRLNEVSSKLDALNAERITVFEQREELQILLWGQKPEQQDSNDIKRLEVLNTKLASIDAEKSELIEEKNRLGVFEEEEEFESFTDMSLIDLMNIEVAPVGTLTRTSDPRLIPAAVTSITADMIRQSGAHSLNEVLEIYVPNLQFIRQHWEPDHLGLRGITGDRDDKYLLIVNGKNMNQKTHVGALSERDLVTMGDIHHIDVVRGPGSAIYGPGAIAMVVNIVTFNAKTFQGTEITNKTGVREEFYSVEVKHGQKLGKDEGIFLYAGVDRYNGAKSKHAPVVSGQSFTTTFDNYQVIGGHAVPYKTVNDGQAFGDEPRIKLHAEYNKDNFTAWARYTEGGQNYEAPLGPKIGPYPDYVDIWPGLGSWWEIWALEGEGIFSVDDIPPQGYKYQQFTTYASYKHEISETFNTEYAVGFDQTKFSRLGKYGNTDNDNGEDELYARIMTNWTPNDKQSVSIGGEYSLDHFGSSGNGIFGTSGVIGNKGWTTTTISGMGEYQHKFNDQLTGFLGLRADKNDYTKPLLSPRYALVWAPNQQDVVKVMYTESVRMPLAEEMRANYLGNGNRKSDPETIKNWELRWERQHTDNLWYALGGNWCEIELIGWTDSGGTAELLGTQTLFAIEGEVTYKKDKLKLGASHGYVKLIGMNMPAGTDQFMTAEPYGHGNDLANWANHISKLQTNY